MNTIDKKDHELLIQSANRLEYPSLIARITDFVGKPIEAILAKLPEGVNQVISEASVKAITMALRAAVATMKSGHKGVPRTWWHRGAVVISGGAGGFFGLLGLPIELPVSTIIMLRSIADIARSNGELITSIDSQLNCLEVFALGGRTEIDDTAKSGYYAARVTLAKAVSEAGTFIAEKGIVDESAPIIVRFISRIAARFEVVVSEKVAADIAPIIGAVGGAAINFLFINHFQSIAIGHFSIRSLERKYGHDRIRQEYEAIVGASIRTY